MIGAERTIRIISFNFIIIVIMLELITCSNFACNLNLSRIVLCTCVPGPNNATRLHRVIDCVARTDKNSDVNGFQDTIRRFLPSFLGQ